MIDPSQPGPSSYAPYTYQLGGSLPSDAPCYVMRQADHDLFEAVLAGTYCYVLNSRQMGKSSLRVRTVDRLWDAGCVCVELELLGIGSQQSTPAQWYGGMIQILISSLDLRVNRRAWLREHEDLSPVQRLGSFIDQVVLPQTKQPLVLCFDEIDSVLGLNFSVDEFFGLVRHWYDKRATDPSYKRLTVVMLGVTTPSDLIQAQHATPFNIGQAIELQGFTFTEALPLLPGLTAVATDPKPLLKAILSWTGGQPFLTQKLCQLVVRHALSRTYASDCSGELGGGELGADRLVANIVRSHLIDHWEAQDEPEHLRTIRDRILRNAPHPRQLLRLYGQILAQGSIPVDQSQAQMALRLTGLVTRRQGTLQVFNPIYQTIFDRAWIAHQLQTLRQEQPTDRPIYPFWSASLTAVGVTALLGLIRLTGGLQPLELWAFDRFMQWRPTEPRDDRFLIVTVSEADIQYQDQLEMDRTGSLSDTALLQVFQTLAPYQPRVIGLDLYHDFPFLPELADYLATSDRVIASCEIARTVDSGNPIPIAAPPGLPTAQVGFTDFPSDPDYVVRRQLLGMPGNASCETNQSLGLRLALRYLKDANPHSNNANLEWQNNDRLTLNTIHLPKLSATAGGYQLSSDEQGGYQILVNYRQIQPRQVALKQVLDGSMDAQLEEWVRDRIILIGLADNKDVHFTPMQQTRVLGVVVHAHMASQLISAVEEGRSLLWWWPDSLELGWIGGWAMASGTLIWGWYQRWSTHRWRTQGGWVLMGGLLVVATGCCYALFGLGGWVPMVPVAIAIVTTSTLSMSIRSLWWHDR